MSSQMETAWLVETGEPGRPEYFNGLIDKNPLTDRVEPFFTFDALGAERMDEAPAKALAARFLAQFGVEARAVEHAFYGDTDQ